MKRNIYKTAQLEMLIRLVPILLLYPRSKKAKVMKVRSINGKIRSPVLPDNTTEMEIMVK